MTSRISTGTALRLTSLAAAAAVALFVTTSFLCAAAFIFVLQKYGPVQACLTGAAIFFVVTMIAADLLHGAQEPDRETGRADREIGGANHAGRPDAGCRRHPDGARDRRQETDPDPRGRRSGAGVSGEPRPKPARAKRRRSSTRSSSTQSSSANGADDEPRNGLSDTYCSNSRTHAFRSRGAMRPRFAGTFVPLEIRGRREDRVRAAPAVSCARCRRSAHEHTGSAENIRHSLRNGFTAYSVLSPVTGFLATVAPEKR